MTVYGGPIMLLRQGLESARYARPWQQILIASCLVIAGAALVLIGVWPAFALIICGGFYFLTRFGPWRSRGRTQSRR
jgi:hypothetical protein